MFDVPVFIYIYIYIYIYIGGVQQKNQSYAFLKTLKI
jgi:hypothetical protein